MVRDLDTERDDTYLRQEKFFENIGKGRNSVREKDTTSIKK